MSKVIGFATQYYTLWSVTEVKHFETINDKHYHVGTTWNYFYIQNLSMDENVAIEKVREKYGIDNPVVDEDLRGVTQRSFSKYKRKALPYTVFPFGKYMMTNIFDCDDVYQLNRVLNGGGASGGNDELQTLVPLKRKVLARKRLIELGELIRYDWLDKRWCDKTNTWINDVPKKYITKRDYENKMKAEASSFLFNDGDKVELSLKFVSKTGYDSIYGHVDIVTYCDQDGNQFIYKGTSAPNINDEYVNIKATIKHNTYRDVKQTMLQRIRIIK